MLMTTDRPVNKKPATDKSNGINAAINSHRHVFREEKSFCRDWKPTLRQEMKDRRLIAWKFMSVRYDPMSSGSLFRNGKLTCRPSLAMVWSWSLCCDWKSPGNKEMRAVHGMIERLVDSRTASTGYSPRDWWAPLRRRECTVYSTVYPCWRSVD